MYGRVRIDSSWSSWEESREGGAAGRWEAGCAVWGRRGGMSGKKGRVGNREWVGVLTCDVRGLLEARTVTMPKDPGGWTLCVVLLAGKACGEVHCTAQPPKVSQTT